MCHLNRALILAILAIFFTVHESASLDLTVLSGTSSSTVNGIRDATPVDSPRDTVMILGGSDVVARYFYDNNTNIFRFGFNQALHFRGGDIAISNDGAFEFRLNEPATYEFLATNFWVGTTVETAFADVTLSMRPDRPIYSENDYVRASNGGIGLQEVGEGRPITTNFGKRTGFLEPGTYYVNYTFGLLDDLMDYQDDSEMHGYFAFYLRPVAASEIRPLLQEGIDFPVDASAGARPWSKSTVTTHDNIDAARSGAIGDGQRSTLKISTPGPGILTFWWKVSAETNADFLIFSMDGREQAHLSGEVDWQRRSVAVPANIHEFEWTYEKDLGTARGQDAAWLDQVTFQSTDGFPPSLAQNIRFEVPDRTQPYRDPVALSASASSHLPVSFTVVNGPGLMQGNNLVPNGAGAVTVRAEQPGDSVFLPARAVERTFTVAGAAPFPLAANLPVLSALVGGEDNRKVSKLALQPDGKLIIGGYFDYVNGKRRGNIARFHADGTLDEVWQPRIDNIGPHDLAIVGDYLFVAGGFQSVNQEPRTWLAKISLLDGSVDPHWKPVSDGTATRIQPVGEALLIGGSFAQIGGQTRWSIAKVSPNGEGAVDPVWNPIPDQTVQAMAVVGTNVYFAGDVLQPGGGTAKNLMRVSMEGAGAVDAGWKTPFQEITTFSIAANEAYVAAAGTFRSNETLLRGLAVFAASDGKLLHLATTEDYINSLEIQGNAVYAGSRSQKPPTIGQSQILKLSLETFQWDTNWTARSYMRNDGIIPGFVIGDLAFRGADLFVAGDFDTFGGSPGSGVALLPSLEGAPIVSPAITSLGFQTSAGLKIQPHPADAIETTHFLITQIEGGELFQQDGVTPILNSRMITKAEGAEGLRFTPAPGFVGDASFRVQASRMSTADGIGGGRTTAAITILADRLNQTITFEPIRDTPFGQRFVELRFSASSGLPLTFTVLGPAYVSGNILTLTGVGEVTIIAIQHGNEAYHPSLRVGQMFNVRKGSQAITFSLAESALPGESMPLTAAASSGLPVFFEVLSGAAVLTNNTLFFTAPGPVSVRALQPGNEFYHAATPVEQTVTVQRRTQTIDFSAVSSVPFNTPAVILRATASSGLPVSFSVISGPGTLAENRLRATGAGEVVVEAVQDGNAEYGVARARQVVTFTRAPQQIVFDPIPFPLRMNTAPVVLHATASSGLPVNFWADATNVTVSGNILSVHAPGRGIVYAQQPGDANYEPSFAHGQGFDIPKLSQVISNETVVRVSLDAQVVPLRARASSGLPLDYVLVSGPATMTNQQLALMGSGYVQVLANQNGNDIYSPAQEISIWVFVDPGTQTIAFQPLTNVFVGQSYPLLATASSRLPVSFSVRSGPGSLVSSNVFEAVAAGTIVIAASQPGNTNYNAAPEVLMSVEAKILKTAQTISFEPVSDARYSDRTVQLDATTSSGLPVEIIVLSGPGIIASNRVTFAGTGRITVRASQPGNDLFEAAPPLDRSFNVSKGLQSIDFPPPAKLRFNAGPATLRAGASSGLPVQFGIIAGPATLSTNTLTLLGAGEVTILALQSGNELYEPAGTVERTLIIEKAAQTIQFNPPAEVNLGSGDLVLNATVDSGLALRYLILSGPATLNRNIMTPLGAGEVRVRAFHSGDANFEEAFKEQIITIKQASQPSVEVSLESNGVFVRWPGAYTNFVVESSTSGRLTDWTRLNETIIEANGTLEIKVLPTNSFRMLRLRSGP